MILNIPIEVPEAIEKMWGIQLYASRYAGWTPTIFEKQKFEIELETPILDEEGNIVPQFEIRDVEINNPITPLEAGISFKQNQLKNEFREVLLQLGREQGEKQASETFEALFQSEKIANSLFENTIK